MKKFSAILMLTLSQIAYAGESDDKATKDAAGLNFNRLVTLTEPVCEVCKLEEGWKAFGNFKIAINTTDEPLSFEDGTIGARWFKKFSDDFSLVFTLQGDARAALLPMIKQKTKRSHELYALVEAGAKAAIAKRMGIPMNRVPAIPQPIIEKAVNDLVEAQLSTSDAIDAGAREVSVKMRFKKLEVGVGKMARPQTHHRSEFIAFGSAPGVEANYSLAKGLKVGGGIYADRVGSFDGPDGPMHTAIQQYLRYDGLNYGANSWQGNVEGNLGLGKVGLYAGQRKGESTFWQANYEGEFKGAEIQGMYGRERGNATSPYGEDSVIERAGANVQKDLGKRVTVSGEAYLRDHKDAPQNAVQLGGFTSLRGEVEVRGNRIGNIQTAYGGKVTKVNGWNKVPDDTRYEGTVTFYFNRDEKP